MIKVDIFSGFLGAGKTTLIKKLLAEAYSGQKVVLIENEFGDIAIDSGFLKDTGVIVNEMNSGCICCTLKGDFTKALREVAERFEPQRIIIEPSGVGKLSDVIDAVNACGDTVEVNAAVAVADAKKCKMYLKNFGEFFKNQIESAGAVILSRTGSLSDDKTAEALALVKGLNPDATVITTPWEQLSGREILEAAELKRSLTLELAAMVEDEEHDNQHEHEHGDDCDCGCHDHEHHHHHADEVFSSFGVETAKRFTEGELRGALEAFDEGSCGAVLRAKGYLDSSEEGGWLWFDYVPGEADIRRGGPTVVGRVCVIGSGIKEDEIRALLGL